MPRYSFRCPNGTRYEAITPARDIWAPAPCCGVPGPRDLAADLATISVACDDPIRRAANSSRIDHALADQGRPLDPLAPKDRFEARHIERATGRRYIGDDISGMRPISQRAILNGERRPGEPTPRV